MKNRKTNKLALNQETLRNLTPDQLREVAGRGTYFMCPTGFTCPECNPPARGGERPQENSR